MPTLPPEPVQEPTSVIEREAREVGQQFMRELLGALHDYTYGTRSHVPGGNDCTDFFDCLNKVQKWADERPDWIADILARIVSRDEELVERLKAYRTLRTVERKEFEQAARDFLAAAEKFHDTP